MDSFQLLQIADNSVELSFNNLNIESTKTIEQFCALAHPKAADFNSLEEKDKIYSIRQYLKVDNRNSLRAKNYLNSF